MNKMLEQESNIINKFKQAAKQNELFQAILKKLSIIKPVIASETYERHITDLSEIAQISRQSTDKCV